MTRTRTRGSSLNVPPAIDEGIARAALAEYPSLVEIATWIEQRFTVKSWYEPK